MPMRVPNEIQDTSASLSGSFPVKANDDDGFAIPTSSSIEDQAKSSTNAPLAPDSRRLTQPDAEQESNQTSSDNVLLSHEVPCTQGDGQSHVDAASTSPLGLKDHANKSSTSTSTRTRTDSHGSARKHVEHTIGTAPSGGRRAPRKAHLAEDDEPLIDTTVTIPLRSKKTERMQKRLGKKSSKKEAAAAQVKSLLSLPAELLHEVLSWLRPSDLFRLSRVSHSTQAFIHQHETTLAKDVSSTRYWTLSRCFPLPVPFHQAPPDAHSALLNTKRQEMLNIHKRPYQHVQNIDPLKTCTCMSCVFAWNNLCMVLDFGHWQKNLDNREPIPMIPRGQQPAWNAELIAQNAAIVHKAISHPLVYIAILELHLQSTISTILRRSRYLKHRPVLPEHRPYHLSYAEATETSTHIVTDAFLSRKGAPSYEFPFHRDNYYNLEAYVPNRKWSREQEKWLYYGRQHENDLAWVKARFGPEEDGEGVARRVEKLAERLGSGVGRW